MTTKEHEVGSYDPKSDIVYKLLKFVLNAYKVMALVLLIGAFGLLVINSSPNLWYHFDGGAVAADSNTLLQEVDTDDSGSYQERERRAELRLAKSLPPVDSSLPTGTHLFINKIGVDATVHTGSNGLVELEKGVWRQSFSSDPKSYEPIVLASHRWGPLYWDIDYRTANSFHDLPELREGDEFTYVYEQRAYTYKVTLVNEAQGVLEVPADADMVLYTCKFFRADDRIVVYAEAAW